LQATIFFASRAAELISIVFGNKKINFDVRRPPNQNTKRLFDHPERYYFVHNFRVHFKKHSLQLTTNKLKISVDSEAPKAPPMAKVTEQFNSKLQLLIMKSADKKARELASVHITFVEYVSSFAVPVQFASNVKTEKEEIREVKSGEKACVECGKPMSAVAKFCSECGTMQP
jgi:zinc-ribbon domain